MDWVVWSFDCAVHFQLAMPIYRIVAYLQASTRTACCLLLGSTINAPPAPLPTHFSSPHQANLSQLFECLFVNFLARKVCCKILCANIVFACFCCAKRQRPDPPPSSPAFPTSPAAQSCWRKLYQCASFFSGVSLPSFFLSFLLAVVCLLLSFFCFRLAFRHVLAFSALICIVFAHFVVACSVFVVASVLRATCNAAASFLCIRFYFITIFFFLLGNFLKTQT